jgi:hypothetical protein
MLWELVPMETESPVWRFSKYKGTVVARAQDGEHARALASSCFQTGNPVSDHASDVIVGDPWLSAVLVICRPVASDSLDMPTEGPYEVVFPKLGDS